MRRPRLGIDIDGTVTCPSALVPFINRDFNTNLQLEDIQEYDLTKAFDVDPNQFAEWFEQTEHEIYTHSPVHTNVLSILPHWPKCFDLHYITARGENVKDTTLEWFHKHEIPYDSIHFVGSHDKVDIAKKLQVDAFFEDKYDNAVTIHNILRIPVFLFDTPWNQGPLPKGIQRIYNWTDAERAMKRLFPCNA